MTVDREPSSPVASETLRIAWIRQQTYSQNASAAQNRFTRFRLWIIRLSLLATLLAVIHTQVVNALLAQNQAQPNLLNGVSRFSHWFATVVAQLGPIAPPDQNPLVQILHLLIVIIPIVVSILVAAAVRFDRGNNWILLRGSAEALKREIFYYRTKVGDYKENRDARLAEKLKHITERMKGSPVNMASLQPYESEERVTTIDPDKLIDLTNPEDYVKYRLIRQFDWYRRETRKYDQRLHLYEWLTYIFGGVGTLLAAINLEAWVAVSSALTASFTSFLEFKRIEATLIGYNQAADSLYDVRALWNSLPEAEKNNQGFEVMVKATEEIIQSENASWLQDMQDRLADLYSKSQDSHSPEKPANHPAPSSNEARPPEVNQSLGDRSTSN